MPVLGSNSAIVPDAATANIMFASENFLLFHLTGGVRFRAIPCRQQRDIDPPPEWFDKPRDLDVQVIGSSDLHSSDLNTDLDFAISGVEISSSHLPPPLYTSLEFAIAARPLLFDDCSFSLSTFDTAPLESISSEEFTQPLSPIFQGLSVASCPANLQKELLAERLEEVRYGTKLAETSKRKRSEELETQQNLIPAGQEYDSTRTS